jgi:hypothetical protein
MLAEHVQTVSSRREGQVRIRQDNSYAIGFGDDGTRTSAAN